MLWPIRGSLGGSESIVGLVGREVDVTQMGGVRHRFGVEGSCTLEQAYRKWSSDLVIYATALVGPTDAPDLVADTFAVLVRRGDERWTEVRDARAYLFGDELGANAGAVAQPPP